MVNIFSLQLFNHKMKPVQMGNSRLWSISICADQIREFCSSQSFIYDTARQ